MREYDFICKDGIYCITPHNYNYIGVFTAPYDRDRNIALKQCKKWCKENMGILHIIN